MDASTRAFNVYGKTESGAGALKAARGGLSTSARRLLILIDGRRSIGELSGMLGVDVVEMGLAQLEPMGFVQFLRHFPDADTDATTTGLGTSTTLLQPTTLPQPTTLLPADTPMGGPPNGIHDAIFDDPQTAPQAVSPATPVAGKNAPIAGREAAARRPLLPAMVLCGLLAGAGALGAGAWLYRHANAPDALAAGTAAGGAAPAPTPAATAPQPIAALANPPRVAHPATPVPAPPTVRDLHMAPTPVAAAKAPPPTALAARPLAVAAPVMPAPAATEAAGARTSLHVRNQVTPEIPQSVRDRGITSGHVVVVLHVSPTGSVEQVERVSANPPDVFDAAMEAAFAKWTFDPLGIPGRMTVDVEIRPPQ